MSVQELTVALKQEARRLGFAAAGACPAVAPEGIDRLRRWLHAGYAGQMRWLPERAAAYEHPRHVLDGARSLLMLALNYRSAEPRPAATGQGRISRYAWGPADYHDVIHERLRLLRQFHLALRPQAQVRGVVDTAPLLEREFARQSGLGWIGKNTLLLGKESGSWFFLAALLTDSELAYDEPFEADHCGTCRACLDACPTSAFPRPYVLDATRCISYLTIELREQVPRELRRGLGDWLFGCDVCQDVCPWNRHAPVTHDAAFQPLPASDPVELGKLFELDDEAFRTRFRTTPLWRARRRGLLRNAALILGNQRCGSALPALAQGLDDPEPLVRAACAWALGQLPVEAAETAGKLLRERLECESDPEVRRELQAALQSSSDCPS